MVASDEDLLQTPQQTSTSVLGTHRNQTLPALQRARLVPEHQPGIREGLGHRASVAVAKGRTKVQCVECGRTWATAAMSSQRGPFLVYTGPAVFKLRVEARWVAGVLSSPD